MPAFKIGDRVAFSAAWLKSTGQVASANDIGHWKGTITALKSYSAGFSIATVRWDIGCDCGEKQEWAIQVANLAKIGPNSRYCAC